MANELGALKADLQKYMKTWASEVAHTAAQGLTDMAKIALEEFYSSYEPKEYLRTYNILKNSYAKYLKNNGRIYYGGVEFSDSRMLEYTAPHKWSNSQIFNSVIFSGMHGLAAVSYPPYDKVVNFRDLGFFLDSCIDAGDRAAQFQSYQVLQF